MKILGHTGSEVYIGHFQGNEIKKTLDIVETYSTKKINISPRISVITAFTDKSKAITALQLELSNMPYVNACTDLYSKWSNVDKIKYFVNQLEKTTTEYSLLVDGYDVLFFKDLDENFINKFDYMGTKILYNATKNNYPKVEADVVLNREFLGEFKYLNAGVVFGRTKDLLDFYKEVLEISKREDIMNVWKSEQLYVRLAANGKSYVKFDHQCMLFQTFSKTSRRTSGDSVIIF